MKHILLIAGIVALAVGLAGLITLSAGPVAVTGPASRAQGAARARGPGAFSSSGQQIYLTGVGHAGPILRTSAGFGMMGRMMGTAACVDCHGPDGLGGPLTIGGASFEVPDIRYASLTTTRTDESTVTPALTPPEIERDIRDGVEPGGEHLDAVMPRWAMDPTDMSDLIGYLKELSTR